MSNGVIARPMEIVKGCRKIAEYLQVSRGEVKKFAERGAPIAVDKSGTMRAEKAELWAWYQAHGKD